MQLDQLKPNVIVRGAIFPEPVQVLVVVPMGNSVKLIGKGLTSGNEGRVQEIRGIPCGERRANLF